MESEKHCIELCNWMKRVSKSGRFQGNRRLYRNLGDVERQGKGKRD